MRRDSYHDGALPVLLVGVLMLGVLAALAFWPGPSPAPVPVPAPTAPAPLPPGTGVDGQDLTAPGRAGVQIVPDAGIPVTVQPPPEPGVGGEVYVSSPAYIGRQRLNAGFYYPSGALHGAWDVGIQRGTRLYAPRAGRVIASNDHVPNHPQGSQYAIPGSPSNWVLICVRLPDGRAASLYSQHMSPGLKVRTGQRVAGPVWGQDRKGRKVILARGTLLGRSGNSGNSTGDHWHVSAQYGCDPGGRYRYLTSPSSRVFAPSRVWAVTRTWARPPTARAIGVIARNRAVGVRRICQLNPRIGYPRVRACTARTVVPARSRVLVRIG